MNSGIYKILNKVTGKFYIGSAVNLKARWTQHTGKLRSNIHPNRYLQASWNLYGDASFEFIILEYCNKDSLPEREQFWIDTTNCCNREVGYNLYVIAGSPLGTKWTEERKVEARERMKNFRHTEEAKAKMSQIKREQDKEIGRRISASKMGHSVSEETRNKISKGNAGKIRSDAHKLAISKANKNKVLSLDTRLKIRKLDKWPHELGSLCKCNECKEKKNANLKFRRNKNKAVCHVQSI